MVKIVCTAIIGGLVIVLVIFLGLAVAPPRSVAGLELVRVCKHPPFRRAKEFIGRDESGQLWYVNRFGRRIMVADDAKQKEVCKVGMLR